MSGRLATTRHLVRRFFDHVRAEPPGPADQQFVHDHLAGPCATLFWAQSPPDQRHAVDVARRVHTALPEDTEAVQAALLHDVGKIEADIGAISRSFATILDRSGLPVTARMHSYRDHGRRGADALEAAGCAPLAVAFARYHPGSAPSGVDENRWRALMEADG